MDELKRELVYLMQDYFEPGWISNEMLYAIQLLNRLLMLESENDALCTTFGC